MPAYYSNMVAKTIQIAEQSPVCRDFMKVAQESGPNSSLLPLFHTLVQNAEQNSLKLPKQRRYGFVI